MGGEGGGRERERGAGGREREVPKKCNALLLYLLVTKVSRKCGRQYSLLLLIRISASVTAHYY